MRALRVAFDLTTVAFEQMTGTGVYCKELVQAYERKFQSDQTFHAYRLTRAVKGREYFLPVSSKSKNTVMFDPFTFWKGYQFDIFHGLNARLPILAGAKRVVTIHDLFSLFGQFSEKSFLEDQKSKIMGTLARADHIITPAKYTAKLLESKLGVPSDKISVVGEAVKMAFLETSKENVSGEGLVGGLSLSKKYLLFVGTLEKRKNILNLLTAYYNYCSQTPSPMELVLVGGSGFGIIEIKNRISECPPNGRVNCLGRVADHDLAKLYSCAQGFLFLSLEEGYGIPIIEAMACGVPVISSNTTSLPEVGAGYTHLVDPLNIDEIVRLILILETMPEDWKIKAAEGRKYARSLTWESVAKKTRDVYLRLLSPRASSTN